MRRTLFILLLLLSIALIPAAHAETQASDPSLAGAGDILSSYATETEAVFLMSRPDGTRSLSIRQPNGSIDEFSLPGDATLEAYHINPGFVTVYTDGAPGCITWHVTAYSIRVQTFRIGSCTYGRATDYLSIHDEETALMTFYRHDDWPTAHMPLPDIVAWAEAQQRGEWVFALDLVNDQMLLPTGESLAIPPVEDLSDAYDRGSRIFLSAKLEDGGHLLRIVTKGEEADVLDVPVPWKCWFDSFHVGPNDDTVLYPTFVLGGEDNFLDLSFYFQDGVWELGVINNGWEVIDFQDYAICRDTDANATFGVHPWHTLESIDWPTLPRTFAEAAAGLTKEGWRFAAEELSLRAAPDASAAAVATCAADVPLAVIRFEGEWALVGLHQENMWDSITGYVPVESLRAEPVSFIPGGETDGWFYTMTIKDGLLHFDSPLAEFSFTPLRVCDGFEDVARALYRAQGCAATPARFDPALYPYLDGLIYEENSIHDLFLTEDTAVIAVKTHSGRYRLEIVANPTGAAMATEIWMPGAFHFDRESWFWGVIEIVMDE